MIEFGPNEKLKAHIDEGARIFGYACEPKHWKSWTPLLRKEGFKAGSEFEIKRALVLIDEILQTEDSEALKIFRRKFLFLDQK
jgi:hypothetical protein